MTPISRGLLSMAFGVAMMSLMDAAIKYIGTSLSVVQVLFFRSTFALIPLLVFLSQQGFSAIKTRRPGLHCFRVVLASGAMGFFVLGVREMSLANAFAIVFSAPFFMVGFTILLLPEPIGRHRIGAMIAGFCGVMIILRPDRGVFSEAAIFLIGCAICYALAQILVRKYGEDESALAFSFWSMSGMALLSGLALPFFWQSFPLDIFVLAAFMGVIGGVGVYFMTEAVRIAPPSAVSPLEYSALIWAGVLDYTLWQTLPTHATLIGSSVIIAAGIYIFFRENHPTYKETPL